MHVEIRKIQITGGSSFMVTLPKEWALANGIKKNDPVRLEPQDDGSLIIYAGEVPEKEQEIKVIKAHSNTALLYRQMVGAYIAGHKEILITSDDGTLTGPVTEVASKFTQTAIGLEILEEDEKHILIKDLMDHSEMRPEKSIERMRVLVGNMITDAYRFATSGNVAALASMERRDTEVDRIHWLVSRQVDIYLRDKNLCKMMNVTPYEVARSLGVSRIIERVGDHVVVVSKNLIRLENEHKSEEVDKSLKEIGNDIIKLFNDSIKSWIDKDMTLAEQAIESGMSIADRIKKSFRKIEVDLETASYTSLIALSSRRIAEYCVDIAEQAINAAME